MAKIRAYKLAEELELDRDEFLKKVRELGIELRGPMAGLDDDQADEIRQRLGGGAAEQRIVKRVGDKVIRRRRRAPPKPEELPAVAEVAAPEEGLEPAAVDTPPVAPEEGVPAVDQPPAVEAEPLAAGAPQPAAEELPVGAQLPAAPAEGVATEKTPAAAPVQPPPTAPAQPLQPEGEAFGRSVPGRPGAPKRPVRQEAELALSLKEQDTLARTMLGNVQHRLEQRRLIVERQSRLNPRRRRAASRKSVSAVPVAVAPKVVRLTGDVTLQEFSRQAGVKVRELMWRMRQIDQDFDRDARLDVDAATLLAEELGIEVQHAVVNVEEEVVAAVATTAGDAKPRPPVVTVMGHVDHGKTSLLDAIRSTNVVSGESGGITQHIGAYQVAVGSGLITFIDTPGHAAFTQMRARGASLTDIVVLVVAADDGVMPQTVEAINHAKAAGVPIMVAINKVDLPDADPQRTKQALLEHELVAEEFGGEVICVEVSATRGTNLDTMLESLALQAEILELTAQDSGKAMGTVIEAELDKGRGPVATFLIREGTLKRGDMVVAGTVWGRVRGMIDDQGGQVQAAGPSMPVQIIGLGSVPEAGDEFLVVKNERETRHLVDHRLSAEKRSAVAESAVPMSAEELFKDLEESDEKELTIVIKADVRGTMEAVQEAIAKLSTERVTTNVIQSGVGGITESDVMLASASSALVLGFRVRPDAAARRAGEQEGVYIRCFEVIHELLDNVGELMSGLLPPKVTEVVTGHAEVRELFVIPRVGTVAGSAVPEGVIRRSNLVRVVRDGIAIYSDSRVMLIGAALIELLLIEADSIKAKRRVVKSVVDRVSNRFGVSVAEVADQDDRHVICIGCVKVGIDPVHLRAQMEKVVRYVDALGLAELASDDILIARLDELEPVDEGADQPDLAGARRRE